MNHNKRVIHNSGPLGMLIQSGQVKKIDAPVKTGASSGMATAQKSKPGTYFRTQAGLEFSADELLYIDAAECEPWRYANRHEDELGDMAELMASIQKNRQLQPVLVRPHPEPHDNIKYEVIFGRRRYLACLSLGIPLMAIKKDIADVREAIALQDAENKYRNDVSAYSNAILYQRLLKDGVFTTEKQLAEQLNLTRSTFNDMMAFAKLPEEIVVAIPDVHSLSTTMAVKLHALAKRTDIPKTLLQEIASEIGRSITSPAKLEKVLLHKRNKQPSQQTSLDTAQVYCNRAAKKLFTYKENHRGVPMILFNKTIAVDYEKLCLYLQAYLEQQTAH